MSSTENNTISNPPPPEKTKKKKLKGKKIKLIEGFRCTPELMYEALTFAPVEIDLKVGGKFSIFGGSVVGEFTELKPNAKICQKWRFNDWEEGVYSEVEITLTAVDCDTCKVELRQTGIPEDDKYNNHYQKKKVKED